MKEKKTLKEKIKRITSFTLAFLCVFSLYSTKILADNDYEANIYNYVNEEKDENRDKVLKDLDKSGYASTEDSVKKFWDKSVSGDKYDIPLSDIERDFEYVMYRLFRKDYMYDVTERVEPADPKKDYTYTWLGKDKTAVTEATGGLTVCQKEKDGNILYHNCDLPNILSEFRQKSYAPPLENPILNANVTTAKEGFLGVPSAIPNDEVPVNRSLATNKYTALEMYGYNLQNTSYKGEWDYIQVNSAARFLANFGKWDRVRLAGKSIKNGVGGFLGGLITDFSWNPIKWFGNAAKKGIGKGSVPILDTSDANVAYFHSWSRPLFGRTVYNAEYISAKLVALRTERLMREFYFDKLEEMMEEHPAIKEYMKVSPKYIPPMSREPKCKNQSAVDASIAARNSWCGNPEKCGPMPQVVECVPMTEEDWFAIYKKRPDVIAWFAKVESYKIENALPPSSTKAQLDALHTKYWTEYMKKKLHDKKQIMKEVYERSDEQFFDDDPRRSPQREISRWVCLPNGEKPTEENLLKAPFLFTKDAEKTDEINPECKITAVRPTIKGSIFGSGDLKVKDLTDTRRLTFEESSKSTSGGLFKWFRILMTKITNSLIDISFSNILEELGLSKIAAKMIEKSRDNVFYPLAALAIAFTALNFLWRFFKFKEVTQFFKLFGILILIFILLINLMYNPKKTVEFIDYVPTKIDNFLLNVIYNKDSEDDIICSSDAKSASRSIQCELWKNNVFIPWLSSQFGTTNYKDLNVENMQNTNDYLIGLPRVHFGSQKYLDNWALYQLELTKSGSITTEDKEKPEGTFDKNMFKLVDLQAGPNNGAESDNRFFPYWASYGRDNQSELLGAIMATLSLIVIGGLSVYKIETSFALLFNIMLLALVAIKSLTPNGKTTFKDYIDGILGLFLKRAMATLLMAILLKLMIAGGESAKFTYNLYMAFTIVILLTMKGYWKDIVSAIDTSVRGNSGGVLSGNPGSITSKVKEMKDNVYNALPPRVKQSIRRSKAKVRDTIAGSVAGTALYLRNINNKNLKVTKKVVDTDEKGNPILDENGDFIYKEVTEKATLRDFLKNSQKSSVGQGAKFEARKASREGYGMFGDISKSLEEMDNELVAAFSGNGRFADNETLKEVFQAMNASLDNKITIEELKNNKELQKEFRAMARDIDKAKVYDEVLKENPELIDEAAPHIINLEKGIRQRKERIYKSREEAPEGKRNKGKKKEDTSNVSFSINLEETFEYKKRNQKITEDINARLLNLKNAEETFNKTIQEVREEILNDRTKTTIKESEEEIEEILDRNKEDIEVEDNNFTKKVKNTEKGQKIQKEEDFDEIFLNLKEVNTFESLNKANNAVMSIINNKFTNTTEPTKKKEPKKDIFKEMEELSKKYKKGEEE